MADFKKEILARICYSDLVYGRINKKLKLQLTNNEIEALVLSIIRETDESDFQKRGKNIYVENRERKTRLIINSFTYRIITADRIVE